MNDPSVPPTMPSSPPTRNHPAAFTPAGPGPLLALLMVALTGSLAAQAPPEVAGPLRVSGPGVAFDGARRVTVVFGGVTNENQFPAETWLWDGRTWRQGTGDGPPPRYSHGMVFDEKRGRVVLFGGSDPQGTALDDTWEHDGVRWQRMSTAGPPARHGLAMAYDAGSGVAILHGGLGLDGEPLTDTWMWNGVRWTRAATTGPAGAVFHRLAYDARRGRVVAFGGRGGGNETWEWDGRTWTRVATSGPPPRDHHAMAYDRCRGRVLIFGGGRHLPDGNYDRTAPWLRDLWDWDGRQWRQLADGGPVSHGGHLAFDSVRCRLVLIGGGDLVGTWEWSAEGWERRH